MTTGGCLKIFAGAYQIDARSVLATAQTSLFEDKNIEANVRKFRLLLRFAQCHSIRSRCAVLALIMTHLKASPTSAARAKRSLNSASDIVL